MGFAFGPGEGVAIGARRIAREGVALAIAALDGASGDPEAEVHEARKTLKRLRALGRLLRDAIGRELLRESDVALRDAGRLLSGARDAAVIVRTYESLVGDDVDPKLRASLLRARRTARRDEPEERRRAVAALRALLPTIDRWQLEGGGWRAVEGGARRIYAQGRRDLERVRRGSAPERLHDLRKRAKDVYYHTQLLRPVWPDVMKAYERALKDLGERLGDDHDLFVLRERVTKAARGSDAHAELIARIDARRAAIVREALPIAERVFAERPKAYAARLAAWCSAAPKVD